VPRWSQGRRGWKGTFEKTCEEGKESRGVLETSILQREQNKQGWPGGGVE
jgi:hypothetical protein